MTKMQESKNRRMQSSLPIPMEPLASGGSFRWIWLSSLHVGVTAGTHFPDQMYKPFSTFQPDTLKSIRRTTLVPDSRLHGLAPALQLKYFLCPRLIDTEAALSTLQPSKIPRSDKPHSNLIIRWLPCQTFSYVKNLEIQNR